MSFQSYGEYRATGIQWLDRLPSQWRLTSFRRCVEIAEGQVNPENTEFSFLPLIAPNHVESGTGRLLELESAAEQAAESGKYFCRHGDVIYSKIRPALRKACVAPTDCLCSADMYPLRPRSGLQSKYLLWWLLSEQFTSLAIVESQRVAMPKINRDSLQETPLPLPSVEEQLAICSFLQCETSKIDALIDDQHRLMDLLDEKRQAVISHAVTKGLNPDAPMKPSGAAWLGNVPVHWTVLPIKRDLELVTSGSRGWASNYSDKGALFIRIANLTRDTIDLELSDVQRVVVPVGTESTRTRLQPDDVLFSITAYLGSVAVVPLDLEAAYVSQHVALARLRGDVLRSRWVAYCALSDCGKAWFEMAGYGGTKVQLSLDDVRDLVVPVPPKPEQDQITAYLEIELGRLRKLTAEAEGAIALLQERRTALISAAVTGQIDVRSLSATEVA